MQYQLKNIEVQAHIGVYSTEKTLPQKLLINVYFEFDATTAAGSDDLSDTVDYATVEQKIREVALKKHYQLLEHFHATLWQKISKTFYKIRIKRITVEKFPFKNGSVVVG